jgi:hypothetical protein
MLFKKFFFLFEWMNVSEMNSLSSSFEFRAGLPDGCFQTKNPNLGKFWRVLLWKILVYFMTIWSMYFTLLEKFGNILWPFSIFYGHLVYFVVIWYILW